MNIISVTKDNIEREHICCAISNNKDCQVAAKKAWLSERFADGLVFKKCDVRGKCFIEYVPAENAWLPIKADGYMPIIEEIAKVKAIPFRTIQFKTKEEAQNAPAPSTSYCLFYNGEFLTNEILSDKKFEKILTEKR